MSIFQRIDLSLLPQPQVVEQISYEQILAELKAELIMKLADLSGVRKEQIESEDNKIYYYLPVTCNVCSIHAYSINANGSYPQVTYTHTIMKKR